MHTLLSALEGDRSAVVKSVFERSSALGPDADDVLGNMKGTTIAGSLGGYGLGPIGTGPGGADTGMPLIGGPAGLRIPGVHRGPGGRGFRDGGALGPRPIRPLIEFTPPIVHGTLDREIVRRVVRQHLNEVRYCYEQALARKPALSGRVVAHFSITPGGTVLASALQ